MPILNTSDRHLYWNCQFCRLPKWFWHICINDYLSTRQIHQISLHQWHSNHTHMWMFKISLGVLDSSMLTDNRDHVIILKRQVLVWTYNSLQHIDPREPHQMLVLSRILDQIMAIQQIADWATILLLMMASAPAQDDPLNCKLNIWFTSTPKYCEHLI